MKKSIIVVYFLLFISNLFGQNSKSKCFALRVANMKYLNDTLLLEPKLYLQGFYVLTNGVYDFEINGQSYNYQRVFKITNDSIYAGYVFDTIPTLKFSIVDNICILLNTCYDGRCGFPVYTKIKKKNYQFKIIEADKYCRLNDVKAVEEKDIEYSAFQYLTGYSSLLTIFRKNGEDFVIQDSVIEKIKKSN